MTYSTDDRPGMDLFDVIFGSENEFGQPSNDFDSIFTDIRFSDDSLPESTFSCLEPCPIINPTESSPDDIPTDLQEWMVKDQNFNRSRPPRLYEFLILLLQKPHYVSYASYKDKSLGLFEVHMPKKVADLWQQVKKRQSGQKMTYDKFARAIRWYYKSDIMTKTNTRYTFQFSSKLLKGFVIDENNNTLPDYSYVN